MPPSLGSRLWVVNIGQQHFIQQPFFSSTTNALTSMIEVAIFHLHVVAALYAFTKRWQDDHIKEGFVALGLIGLVFTIGWAITGAIARLITPTGGFATWFTADTMSLVLLLIPEILLFRAFFLKSSS
jgi:uncharacterized membrane protein YhdT